MTVAQLIAALSKLPQDAEVVLAKDAEGNGFETLGFIEPTRWDSEDGCLIWNEAGEEHEGIDGEVGSPCVVLWP